MRLNSRNGAWIDKKKNKKNEKHTGKLVRKNPKIKKVFINSRRKTISS